MKVLKAMIFQSSLCLWSPHDSAVLWVAIFTPVFNLTPSRNVECPIDLLTYLVGSRKWRRVHCLEMLGHVPKVRTLWNFELARCS